MVRLALPSDGDLYEPALGFLAACGMAVERSSPRRYTASIPSVGGASVLFQRSADITTKVEEGNAELGIVGLDRYMEYHNEDGDAILVVENLGFGRCELVVAVPDGWVDVSSVADLADLAVEFREKGRELRVATKYPRLVQRFFALRGVHYLTLVPSSGTLEAAPAMGYADIIADISASGATIRENRLKTLEDGTILASQACLIGNRVLLGQDGSGLEMARRILERVEAYLRAGEFYSITANIRGPSADAVAQHVLRRPEVAGVVGPTVAKVYSQEGDAWFAVTTVVPKALLQIAVDHLRCVGGNGITVFKANYVFQEDSEAYRRLVDSLKR